MEYHDNNTNLFHAPFHYNVICDDFINNLLTCYFIKSKLHEKSVFHVTRGHFISLRML